MDCQDWEPVIISNHRNLNGRANVNGHVKNHPVASAAAAATRKLEEDDIPKLKKHLSIESKQKLIAKRLERSMKQTDVDRACSFPPNTIRDFENGRTVPTPTQLNVLNRVLGLALKFEAVA